MRHLLTVITLFAAAMHPASARAQQGDTANSPSVHREVKGAGRAAKSGLKHLGSQTHHVLKTTGRNIKAGLKKATGDTMPKDPNHKPGGLNKAARQVSHAFKTTGRAAKSGLKTTSSKTHRALQKTGRSVKDDLHDSTKGPNNGPSNGSMSSTGPNVMPSTCSVSSTPGFGQDVGTCHN